MQGDIDAARVTVARDVLLAKMPSDVNGTDVPGLAALIDRMARVGVVNDLMQESRVPESGGGRCDDDALVEEEYRVHGTNAAMTVDYQNLFETNVKEYDKAGGVKVECVIERDCATQTMMFCAKRAWLRFRLGKDVAVTRHYHMTSSGLDVVLREGLITNLKSEKSGFFGRGIYLTPDMTKANDYAPQAKTATVLRAMLVCDVLEGKSHTYATGHFDRTLTAAPLDSDSVTGYIRRAKEVVVYNCAQVLIKGVILYRFLNTSVETNVAMNPPTPVPDGAFIVLITAALSEFFSKLESRAGPPDSEKRKEIRKKISELLRQIIDVTTFVADVGTILGAGAPPDLETKLTTELAKSRLPPPPAVAAPVASVLSDTDTGAVVPKID